MPRHFIKFLLILSKLLKKNPLNKYQNESFFKNKNKINCTIYYSNIGKQTRLFLSIYLGISNLRNKQITDLSKWDFL